MAHNNVHSNYENVTKNFKAYSFKIKRISQETTSITNQMALSLHTLPVELVYRIFDNLDDKALFLSCRGISARLNDILDTYHRHQVIFRFIMSSYSHYL